MAIGIAEAIGQQGDLRLPTRSVAATKSPLDKFAQKGRVPTRDLTTTIAQKLITFDKPVLPGDENERTNNAVMLVDFMYKKQSMDPNYNPMADPEFVKAFSEFQVKENKMQDLYRRVNADLEQRQAAGERFMDVWDARKLTDATGPEFEAAKAAYNGGDKFAMPNVMAINPWTQALGSELKINNVKNSYYKGRTKITEDGFDPNQPGAQKFADDQIEAWLRGGSLKAISAKQDAITQLLAQNPNLDLTNPQAKQQVNDFAKKMVYDQYVRSFPLKKGMVKSFGYSGGGGRGGAATGGFYEFGTSLTKNPFDPTGKSEVQPIGFSGKPSKTVNLKDKSGVERGEVEIQTVYVDKDNNVVGYEGQYRGNRGKTKTGYFPADKNPVDAPSVLPNLKTEYKAMYGKDLNTGSITKPMEGKGKTGSTNRFVPDFLNDAIKNIGDFLRPRAPEPPQPGGPDVEGMV